MEINELANTLEAVLFACGESVETKRLCQALDTDITSLHDAAALLDEKYENSGIELLRLDSAYQLATKRAYAPQIKAVLEIKRSSALSPAALEALTVVAYNQPVTKAFVESVRGVDSSGVVNSLVEKGLLCEAGRLELPGRPIAYVTTDNFLRAFGLSSIKELPPLPEQSGQVTIDEIIEAAEENAADDGE
ncbi:SMC-Scp complex subunit ScpB [Ruminococcus albus]|uniref:Segregation and condensation protein B n=1 Tax=Ruminococcus albus 8 TaxID=246199 RepID=E9SBE4_RUMAL|nr:SMC-Scp complex subunit ScpB [Ruminococcus albus]EGC03436.1 segregation and condensation protein B [Ruminococcus albus 8]MBE6873479.1 SMC-Scp complex subunit ScpB [Ruminococcus albus]MCC3350285.1 SMC-Scp complex subunit ScpB [Ruminococcus albus 8]